jgi:hypothetical protein
VDVPIASKFSFSRQQAKDSKEILALFSSVLLLLLRGRRAAFDAEN